MTVTSQPEASLSLLPKVDGSATYSYAGYTIAASVNGPIEPSRRDEHPYEAHVDVIVRPASGVGGTPERHLESLLQLSLKQLILVKNFPRCLIQLVLQVTARPENDYINKKLVQASLDLSIIPALLQTAVLALLSGAIPLRATVTSAVMAVLDDSGKKQFIVDPSPRQLAQAQSTHVLAFTSLDEPLLLESEGEFTMEDWDNVFETSRSICCAPDKKTEIDMVLGEDQQVGPDMRQFMRSTLDSKTAADLQWKWRSSANNGLPIEQSSNLPL